MQAKLLFAPILVLLLSACATVDVKNPSAVAAKVAVQRDNFKKVDLYVAPRFESNTVWTHLRAAKMQSGPRLTQQVVVEISTWGWVFYDTAYDDEGNRLDVTVLSREVGSCSSIGCLNTETVAVNLPEGYVQRRMQRGLRIQVSGRGGKKVIEVPGSYLSGFVSSASFVR